MIKNNVLFRPAVLCNTIPGVMHILFDVSQKPQFVCCHFHTIDQYNLISVACICCSHPSQRVGYGFLANVSMSKLNHIG